MGVDLEIQKKIIRDLISEGSMEEAENKIFTLLCFYPYNHFLLKELAFIYRLDGRYEDALAILEDLNEQYVFRHLLSLYIKIGDIDKIYEFYQKYFKDNVDLNTSDYRMLIYLRKLFEEDFKMTRNKLTYDNRQVYAYKKNDALSYMKRHYQTEDLNESVIFSDKVDAFKLFDKAKRYITKNPEAGRIIGYTQERYVFYVSNVGIVDKKETDYCIAETFVGSSDIIYFRPVWGDNLKDDAVNLKNPKVTRKLVRIKNELEKLKER